MHCEPRKSPSSLPWQISRTSWIPAKCWARKPGLLLLPRIFWILIGMPLNAEQAIAFRIICPPPSNMLPVYREYSFTRRNFLAIDRCRSKVCRLYLVMNSRYLLRNIISQFLYAIFKGLWNFLISCGKSLRDNKCIDTQQSWVAEAF